MSRRACRRRGESLYHQLARVARAMEDSSVAEYVEFLRSPRRVIWSNFLGGAARGLGFAFGASVLAAIGLYLLGQVAWSNLPLIGKYIGEIVEFVELNR
ncbi:MAG: DUF5665 domain-containing protein [Bacillota bacterium]